MRPYLSMEMAYPTISGMGSVSISYQVSKEKRRA